jgi:hypothetical protein
MRRQNQVELAILTAVWACAIAIIDPRGNFPLHDDWDFAIATWSFARTGHFHFTQFTAVALRAQVLWGALWTRALGDSFNVLRASTLVLSLGSVLLVNRILARAGAVRGVRMLASLALLVHPIFLWASCTYMTDVPFVFAALAAFYCFVRALQDERVGWLVAGCCAVLVACFIRQNGAYLFGAPLLLLLMRRVGAPAPGARPRAGAPTQVAVIGGFMALFAAVLLLRPEWLTGAPKMLRVHYHMWLESSFRLPEQVAVLDHYTVFNAQNCALFFLPLTVGLLWLAPRSRAVLGVIAAIIGWRIIDLAHIGHLVPYNAPHLDSDILPGNVWIDFGIGTPYLFDTFTLAMPYPFTLGTAGPGRALLTALSAALATVLVAALLRASDNVVFRLAALTAAIGTLALFASGLYYDRYSLDSAWAVAIALPLVVPWQKRGARIAAIVALVAVALFSVLSVQEYFRWQRARWKAFDDLRARGVAVARIDAGAEAFGLYELADAPLAVARRGHPPREYAITFRPLPGYRVVATYPFRSFLGLRRGTIYILECGA